jgi:hypothetical protein
MKFYEGKKGRHPDPFFFVKKQYPLVEIENNLRYTYTSLIENELT